MLYYDVCTIIHQFNKQEAPIVLHKRNKIMSALPIKIFQTKPMIQSEQAIQRFIHKSHSKRIICFERNIKIYDLMNPLLSQGSTNTFNLIFIYP